MPAQRYRKKPVVIEAILFEHESAGSVIAEWCGGSNERQPDQIQVSTLEGVMTANLGDWVIKGVKGEFYPCKPDIFAATYDPCGVLMPGAPMKAELLIRFEGAEPAVVGTFEIPLKLDYVDGAVKCTPDFSALRGLAGAIAGES